MQHRFLSTLIVLCAATCSATPAGAQSFAKFRAQEAERRQARLEASRADDWSITRVGGLAIVRSKNAPAQRCKTIAACARAIDAWLSDWSGLAAPKGDSFVLRLCGTREERDEHRDDDAFSFATGEVVVLANGPVSTVVAELGPALLEQRLDRTDPGLFRALPAWLSTGLIDHAGRLRPDSETTISWELPSRRFKSIHVATRLHRPIPIRELFSRSDLELIRTRPQLAAEAEILCRFLTLPKAPEGAQRALLRRYLTSLAAACRDAEDAAWPRTLRRFETPREAYVAQCARARQRGILNSRRRLEAQRAAFAAATGSWSDADWKAVQLRLRQWVLAVGGN